MRRTIALLAVLALARVAGALPFVVDSMADAVDDHGGPSYGTRRAGFERRAAP